MCQVFRRKNMTDEFAKRHDANAEAARAWWSSAPRRRLLGDHLPLNGIQQARLNGAVLPWPDVYDVIQPETALAYQAHGGTDAD
jgi:hypothetical protein